MTIDGNEPPFRGDEPPLGRVLDFDSLSSDEFDSLSSDESDGKVKLSRKRVLDGGQDSDFGSGFLRRPLKVQKRSYRNVRAPKAKFPKIVPHVVDMKIVGKAVIIHGVEYPIKPLAEGNFHKVFEFTGAIPVDLGDDEGSVILKGLHPMKDPFSLVQVNEGDIKAYENFLADGVPQPKVYVRPDQFTDTEDPKYGDFWIVEKMDGRAPIGEQFVLDFVKHWITKSVNEKREIIPDFYPRNVMVKGDQCYIVDPSLADEEDWLMSIYGFVIAWSNGKQETYDFLTADFPVGVKQNYDGKLAAEKEKNGGNFPVTNQTHI